MLVAAQARAGLRAPDRNAARPSCGKVYTGRRGVTTSVLAFSDSAGMSPRNARAHQVHIENEPQAEMRMITSNTGVYRISDRVLVETGPGLWRRGCVDYRTPSGPGGVIMVTPDGIRNLALGLRKKIPAP